MLANQCDLYLRVVVLFWVSLISYASFGFMNPDSLPLSQTPLYLSIVARPNVMILLDDTETMDYEVLTAPHWSAPAYFLPMSRTGPVYVRTGLMLSKIRTDNIFQPFPYIHALSSNFASSDTNHYAVYEEASQLYTGETINYKPADLNVFFNQLTDWRFFSSQHNLLYYNPTIKYKKWPSIESPDDFDNIELSGGERISLNGSLYVVSEDTHGYNESFPDNYLDSRTNIANGTIDLWDTHHVYIFEDNKVKCYTAEFSIITATSTGLINYVFQYDITDRFIVSNMKRNYAIWFQFYRTRLLALKSTLFELIKKYPHYRYSFAKVSDFGSILKKAPAVTYDMQPSNLYDHNINIIRAIEQTPIVQTNNNYLLHETIDKIGSYFTETQNGPIYYSCQNNYLLLATDGDVASIISSLPGDDVTSGDIDQDGVETTVADIARYYYITDLRPDLENNTTNTDGTLMHQHLTMLVLGFGLFSSIKTNELGVPVDSLNNPLSANSVEWGHAGQPDARIRQANDLHHAAFNSGGLFLDISKNFFEAFEKITESIERKDTRLSNSILLDSSNLKKANILYQCQFNPYDWSGDIFAYSVNQSTGAINPTPLWSAEDRLNVQSDQAIRSILFSYSDTLNHFSSRSFFSNHLPESWRSILLENKYFFQSDDEYLNHFVNFLRGNMTYATNTVFRRKSKKLGDIIHSSPVLVKNPDQNSRLYVSADYSIFKKHHRNRRPLLYVGANDGMLHAFDALTGDEYFAYLSFQMAPFLHQLASPLYKHYAFFDAKPKVQDIYDGQQWRTILVTGFGVGVKGLVALDITNPEAIKQGSNPVLWELSASDKSKIRAEEWTKNENMGHQLHAPSIGKMKNNQWAVIVGNGYNSIDNEGSDNLPRLFILNALTGRPIKIISVPSVAFGGDHLQILSNGLCSPMVIGNNITGEVEYIYAADVRGHIWKFDCNDENPNNWRSAYRHSNGLAYPLFRGDIKNPISAELNIVKLFNGNNLIIFGTGRYLLAHERYSTFQAPQYLCAIEDNVEAEGWILDYQLQSRYMNTPDTIHVGRRNDNDELIRSTETTVVRHIPPAPLNETMNWDRYRGWRLYLMNNPLAPAIGERILQQPIVNGRRLKCITFSPYNIPCGNGGYSWVLGLDAYTGVGFDDVVFDLNQDGVFDQKDSSQAVIVDGETTLVPSSSNNEKIVGVLFDGLILSSSLLSAGNQSIQYLNTSNGIIFNLKLKNNLQKNNQNGRQAWRQIK
ncbi:MAG: hypothetical protein HAW62_03725 [Endozoicomonadaceae bacterium]|nr:hypothetical protein [Endozoicomonadaceae bacterium]